METCLLAKISGDTLVRTFPGNITGGGMKMCTKEHFCFVGQYKRDTTNFNSYGGGTYTLNGNQLEETLFYFVNSDKIGSKVKILMEVKGDTLTQTYPVDDNWQFDKSNYTIEKWIKLE